MPDYLEIKVDKFSFKIATDRAYSPEGVWASAEGQRIRIGLSDYLQQRSGDIAFAEIRPQGSEVAFGDEMAVIETIKVNISLASPVTGRIIEVNPEMDTGPEAINQDPYGAGWIAVIEAANWETDRLRLLDPQAYFELVKVEADNEVKR